MKCYIKQVAICFSVSSQNVELSFKDPSQQKELKLCPVLNNIGISHPFEIKTLQFYSRLTFMQQ